MGILQAYIGGLGREGEGRLEAGKEGKREGEKKRGRKEV